MYLSDYSNTNSEYKMSSRPVILEKLLFLAGAAAFIAFIVGLALDIFLLRIVSKPVPVLAMLAWVLWCAPADRYSRLIALGLFLSVFGDVFLEIGGENLFIAGLVAFLLGHLCYTGAYLTDTRAPMLRRAVPFAAFGIGMFLFLRPNLEELAVPVAVYMTVICTMMWRAAARVGAHGQPRFGEWTALAGAVLYAVGDSLIAIDKFHASVPSAHYVIITAYWLGQFGIALSVRRPV